MSLARDRRKDPTKDPAVVRKMADLLRSGATMLAEHCPKCGLPLFRLKTGEVVCPIHGRVYIVKSESEAAKVTVQGVLEELEKTLVEKISSNIASLRHADFTDEDKPRALILWLEALERTERILQNIRSQLQEGIPSGGSSSREREEK